MPTTVPTGFIYPDNNSEASINVAVAALAGSVEAKVGPYVVDTGFVTIPNLNGFVGTITYRRVGKMVEISALGSANFVSGVGFTIGNIPLAVRPNGTRRGACWLSGSNVGTVGSTPTGNIDINHASGATRTSVQATLLYLVD